MGKRRRKPAKNPCEGLKKDGSSCSNGKMKNFQFCYAHNKKLDKTRTEKMIEGQKKSLQVRKERQKKRMEDTQRTFAEVIELFTYLPPVPEITKFVPPVQGKTDMIWYLCLSIPVILSEVKEPGLRYRIWWNTVKILGRLFEGEEVGPGLELLAELKEAVEGGGPIPKEKEPTWASEIPELGSSPDVPPEEPPKDGDTP